MNTLTDLWAAVADFWQANAEPVILGTGAALTLLIVFLLWRFLRTTNRSKVVSTLAAVVVMAWTSEGLLAVAIRNFKLPVGFAAMTFFVFEAMMLAAALKAEEHRKAKGVPGAAGGYVFAIAAASGVVASFGAHNPGEVVLRVMLPLLAVGLWWIFLVAERPDDRPEWRAEREARAAEQDARWTVTPRTVLVWLGLMKPGKVTITEAQRQRRVARLTNLGFAVYSWPAWAPPHWWARWRLGRLGRHVDDPMVVEARVRAERAANIVSLVVPARRPVVEVDAAADIDSVMVADTRPVTDVDAAPDMRADAGVDTAADADMDTVAVIPADMRPDTDTVMARTNGRTYERTYERTSDRTPQRTEVRTPARTSKGPDTATKADKILARFPDMDAATLAKRLSISDRQARRYIAARQNSAPADDDQERHPAPVKPANGTPQPDLIGALS